MIYIHIPFCHRKCAYCAFYSVASQRLVHSFVDALLEEMTERRGEQSHPIRTVYFGGGTPSLLPLDELSRIVDGLRRNFDLSQMEEATLECNPEDLDVCYLEGLRGLDFFNRLSIGIQSLDDSVLHLLNRRHSAQQALDAVANAHLAGFGNISVDFIYGVQNGIDTLSFNQILPAVNHISAYSLTVEPGTALAVQIEKGRVELPDDDEVVRQYHTLHCCFHEAGFEQYEVSNYARQGFESRHNSRYWDRTPYLGLGPGAHSFDGKKRRWNISNVEEYSNRYNQVGSCDGRKTVFEEETLSPADAFNETLMTALRTVCGLPVASVPDGYKKRLHCLMQPYIECGWISLTSTHYKPTAEGLLHADGIAAALFI